MAERVTRGHGLLEGFLARRRAATARALLRDLPRRDRLLDIGCGSHPLFLQGADFRHRVGIDRVAQDRAAPNGVTLLRHDFDAHPTLPFRDQAFDAVTMLAVFEHIRPGAIPPLLADVRRVLTPAGTLVLTTPARWTAPLLRGLALLRLVSREEVEEHKDAYDHAALQRFLVDAGFDRHRLRFGSFELSANLWVTAAP